MNRPIVYYAVALLLGGLTYMLLNGNKFLGAVIIALFFIVTFYTVDKRFCILAWIFFFIGIMSYYFYFNVQFNNNRFSINIAENKNNYIVGSYLGRKVVLKNLGKSAEKLNVGMKITVIGKFTTEKTYEKGIVGNIKVSKITAINKNFLYYIYSLRRELFFAFNKKIGKDNTAFVMAICFGDTSYLSDTQIYDFQKLGVIHAISVSGFHMAIIYKIVESIGGISFATGVSLFYVVFTGLQPPAIRSFVMILIYKISKKVNMNYDGLSSLSLSAIIIFIWKPYYLLDLGFSLSFLATLGILLYYNNIQRALYFLPKKINESVSTTLSAQFFSMPYMALTLHTYSPGFFIGNLILIPLYTLIVLLGNAAALVTLIAPLFNALTFVLNSLLQICNTISNHLLVFSSDVIYMSSLQGIFLLLIYTIFILQKHGRKKFVFLPAVFFFIIIFTSFFPKPIITHFITFQGDNYVIDYKNEKILIMSAEDYTGEDIKKLQLLFKPTKFVVLRNNTYRKSIDNSLYVLASNKESNNNVDLKLYYKGKTISFTKQNTGENKYDIINTNAKKQNLKYMNFYNIDRLTTYEILFGRVKIVN